MAESSKRGSVLGASVEITVEIEVEMIPTGNLLVKEVAGWAKAEFTPENLVAAVKKWASCVRDHAAYKATKKKYVYLSFSLTSFSHYVKILILPFAYMGFRLIINIF